MKYIAEKHKIILKTIEQLENKKSLDIGCGPNKIGKFGIDKQPFNGVDFVSNIEKEKLPFMDNYFNIIILSDILEHLKNPSFAIKEAKRVLKQNGTMIITIPNSDNILFRLGIWKQDVITGEEHVQFWGEQGFKDFLKQNGLFVSRFVSTYYFRGGFFSKLFPKYTAFCLYFECKKEGVCRV